MKSMHKIFVVTLLVAATAQTFAAVSAEEAKKLGTTLTPMGAEVAGNADHTIPAYTGGLTTPPADYKPGSGIRPDPFANEAPLYSIKATEMAKYESKLTVGTKELLKKYPATMRVDVYPTHRTAAFPKSVIDNTLKNATAVKAANGGLGLEGTHAGVPFPIPKTGMEVMWNHVLRYVGQGYYTKYDSINVDSAGKAVLATAGEIAVGYPYYDAKRTTSSKPEDIYVRVKIGYVAPARRVGEALLVEDHVDPLQAPRKAWQYLPGQRRVKLAPDVAYDTPNPGAAGQSTYDDAWVFNGAMDRYDWKLVGKQEMIIPYNDYKLTYAKEPFKVTTPNHLNPDFVRWELHRVWVVEATLKPGKRHIYAKRTFYIDEATWQAVASDEYDARGQLFRAGFDYPTMAYEQPAPANDTQSFQDFIAGGYNVAGLVGAYPVGVKYNNGGADREWTPDSLAGAGVR
jgi:hypothetical protein